jgi:hypothetical protein
MIESIRLSVSVGTIILQLVGFVIMLLASKAIKPSGGGFTFDYSGTPNMVSMTHSRWNRVGIGFVIAGLLLQLITLTL